MLLSAKFLNLLVVAIVAIHRSAGTAGSGEPDEDNSIKQALFLVELLKSDFAKILRENINLKNNLVANSSEENSTCPTPIEDSNSTSETNVTLSGASSPTEVWTPTTTVPPANIAMRLEDPRYPFSSWPPMPMQGYPLPGPDQQSRNFPADENNYRFPYRFGRRRLMPDYYYYGEHEFVTIALLADKRMPEKRVVPISIAYSPMQSRGKFRRVNGPDPITGDISNATATTQEQTTPYLLSTTSEVTSLRVEETSTNITQQPTSALPTAQPSAQTNSPSPNQTTTQAPSTESTTQSSSQPTTLLSTQPTQSKIGARTPISILKATSAIIYKSHEKIKLNYVGDKHLRRRKTTTEKITSEDVVMSQVASELINEFKGTKSENISHSLKKKLHSKPKKKTSTTMKIYLRGSSRLPVPLPENNAFCHSYPHNALCGSML